MLDEICPIQFVEGLNEGADLSDVDSVVITYYSSVGLLYIPKVSYSLTRLEIMLTFGDFLEGTQIRVELCSDYEDKPGDIILSSGSFVPKEVYGGWREVTLKPVSVIKNMKYWVTIHPNGCPTAFIAPKKGKDYTLSVKTGTNSKWETPPEDVNSRKVMLRFHGRIFPVSAS